MASTFVWGLTILSLLGRGKRLWHPYIGAWAVAFASEIAILVASEVNHESLGQPTVQTALHSVRLTFILLLLLSGLYYALSEKPATSKRDEENEPLLASRDANAPPNGTASPLYGSIPASGGDSDNGDEGDSNTDRNNNNDDEDDDDDDEDLGSGDDDEPKRVKELRKQQQKRLKERGSWIAYLKDYKILVALVWPSDDRYVQCCLAVLVLVLVVDRALNVLIPRQLGVITNQLASMADTGKCPYRRSSFHLYGTSVPAKVECTMEFARIVVSKRPNPRHPTQSLIYLRRG